MAVSLPYLLLLWLSSQQLERGDISRETEELNPSSKYTCTNTYTHIHIHTQQASDDSGVHVKIIT